MVSEVLITSATGNNGYTLLKTLTSSDYVRKNCSIRCAAFSKSSKTNLVREHCEEENCKYHEFDCDIDDAEMETAVRGCDTLVIIPSRSQNRVQHVRKYIKYAKQHGVGYIILYSFIRPSGSDWGRHYEEIEELVENSGINYTFIRTTVHMQTLFLFAPDLNKGVLPLPIGTGSCAWINNQDIASFAKKLIVDQDSSNYQKAFHLTGPKLLNGRQIASIASNNLGYSVEFKNVTDEASKNLMIDSGFESWLAEEFVGMFRDIRNHKFNVLTSQLFKQLVGEKQHGFDDFFYQNKQRFSRPQHEKKPSYGEPELARREKGKTVTVTGGKEREWTHVGAGVGRREKLSELSDEDLHETLWKCEKWQNELTLSIDHLNYLVTSSSRIRDEVSELSQDLRDILQQ